ncbi:MAG: LytTR family DNA-binding domain-containing protein [Verrucomicrobia subdivision 3 bacterium]|nr:LytTR family DNA-binding domain-containing protein [Limisphaerales bacterium]
MKIRALIVDDEPLARERLASLLSGDADVEVVGQCANGVEALSAIQEKTPDLVFLDVQMPELDGFGVLAALEGEKRPAVIFVTAHDRFALKAFEVHAIDYLLKPFDRERFQKALQRAKEQLQTRQAGEVDSRLAALLASLKAESKTPDRIPVKGSGRVILVKTSDIDWIEAADNYVNLHTGKEAHLHRETMAAMEEKLPAGKFMRISRSAIVNVDRIKELQPMFHGDYTVILQNGTRLTLSRGYREALHQLLGKVS